MKINELWKVNTLDEMCGIMLNCYAFNGKYDYYFINDVQWLLENQKEIEGDFREVYDTKDIDFQILVNTNFIKNTEYYWNSLKKLDNDIHLFGSCINEYYMDNMEKDVQEYVKRVGINIDSENINKDVLEKHEKFKNIKDIYDKKMYFEKIVRR